MRNRHRELHLLDFSNANKMKIIRATYLILILSTVFAQDEITKPWIKHIILPTNDAAEGQACRVNTVVANDFDKDGNMDVIASYDAMVILYRGPDWKPQVIVQEMPINPDSLGERRGCIHSTIMDVDGDGDMDFIGANRMLFWLECPPKPFSDTWNLRMINYDVNPHCLITGDVDRDGKLEFIANSWPDETKSKIPNSITFFRVPKNPFEDKLWKPIVFADRDAPKRNHYMGFGDVNKDGRPDIACAAVGVEGAADGWFAWWEQPKNPDQAWKKHLLSDKEEGASNILICDINNDGHMDFVGSRGHGKGMVWFKGPEFVSTEIDATLITPHSLAVTDLDGNGTLDIVSCGSHPDGIAVIYLNDGKEHFTRQIIGEKQGSYDIRIMDMDGDGDLDVLIGGAATRNIVWYENPSRSKK
jgi:FG-GAP-like repeat